MKTKIQLTNLYHQLEDAKKDRMELRKRVKELFEEISKAAIARKFDEVPPLVDAYDLAKT